jgi:nucleotidyltransferase/DNA polymerase involved in DNA repair
MIFIRNSILAWTLAAAVLAAPALRAADTPADVLKACQTAVDKLAADCCDDLAKRAARAEEKLAKHFEKKLCQVAARERKTMLSLIKKDYDRCVRRLTKISEEHFDALEDATHDLDPELEQEFFDQLEKIVLAGLDALNTCKDAADKRVNDAYTKGAADAGCDDDDDDGEN